MAADLLRDLLALWAEPREGRASRAHVAAYAALSLVATATACSYAVVVARPIVSATPPPALYDAPDAGSVRYGLTESVRREIFSEIAASEASERAQGVAGFPNLPWSQEDHRCAFERAKMKALASRYSISLSQVYLVLDEGIREKWPGPDGQPLKPTTVPLEPRRK